MLFASDLGALGTTKAVVYSMALMDLETFEQGVREVGVVWRVRRAGVAQPASLAVGTRMPRPWRRG